VGVPTGLVELGMRIGEHRTQQQLASPVHDSGGNIRWDMLSDIRGFDHVVLLRYLTSSSDVEERRWSCFC
jgi:hypothetical protein